MSTTTTTTTSGRRIRRDDDAASLYRLIEAQGATLAALASALDEQRMAMVAIREQLQELRSMAGRGQREVLHRIDQLHGRPAPDQVVAQPTVEPVAEADPEGGATPHDRPAMVLSRADYARLIIRVRTLVRTMVPGRAVIAVISRGDDALIDLDGRCGWHFPRCDDGRYAGHYPKDSASAVTQLEDLRRRGARYLVIPATALWWLDHYDGFRRHLDDHYRLVVQRADTCAIFALDGQEGAR